MTMHVLPRFLSVVALLAAFCGGCGSSATETVKFGSATVERKSEFLKAVEDALKGFDDLDDPNVTIGPFDDGGRKSVAIRSNNPNPRAMERAVAVVVTNIALKYPGVGFMRMDEGAWKILVPDEVPIPVEGEFGLNIQ